jgi:hypothetical protein
MKTLGPNLTLLGVAAFAVVLLAVNATHPAAASQAAASQAAASQANTSEPTPPSIIVAAAPAPIPTDAATVAPDPPPPSPVRQAVFAGRTTGKEATVAIAVEDGTAVAYVCDGHKLEAWLTGTLSGDRLALAGPRGAALTGTVTGNNAGGEITVGSRHWPYSARIAGKPAGLYEGRSDVRGVPARIGWIVLPDGVQVGVLSAAGANPQPAPPLDVATLAAQVDGVSVPVRALTGADPLIHPR